MTQIKYYKSKVASSIMSKCKKDSVSHLYFKMVCTGPNISSFAINMSS